MLLYGKAPHDKKKVQRSYSESRFEDIKCCAIQREVAIRLR